MSYFRIFMLYVFVLLGKSWKTNKTHFYVGLVKYTLVTSIVVYFEALVSRDTSLDYDFGWIFTVFISLIFIDALSRFLVDFSNFIHPSYLFERVSLFVLTYLTFVVCATVCLFFFIAFGLADRVDIVFFVVPTLLFLLFLVAPLNRSPVKTPRFMRTHFQQLMYHMSFRLEKRTNVIVYGFSGLLFIIGMYSVIMGSTFAVGLIALGYILFFGNLFDEEIYSHYSYKFSNWNATKFILSSISIFSFFGLLCFLLSIFSLNFDYAVLNAFIIFGSIIFCIINTYGRLSADKNSFRSFYTQIAIPATVGGLLAVNPIIGVLTLLFSLKFLFSLVSKRWNGENV